MINYYDSNETDKNIEQEANGTIIDEIIIDDNSKVIFTIDNCKNIYQQMFILDKPEQRYRIYIEDYISFKDIHKKVI